MSTATATQEKSQDPTPKKENASPFDGVALDITLPALPMTHIMEMLRTTSREIAIRENRIKGAARRHEPLDPDEYSRLESLQRLNAWLLSIRQCFPSMADFVGKRI